MSVVASPLSVYPATMLSRLVASKILQKDHVLEVPDLPHEFIPEEFALFPPTPRKPVVEIPPFLVAPFSELQQLGPLAPHKPVYRWLPATGQTGLYWVRGVVMVLGKAHLPSRQELLGCNLSYGEAACLMAQFPEFGSCRTRQPRYPVLQARYSRRRKRIVLNDESHGGNDMFRFVTFLKNGGRLNPPSAVMSVRVPAAA